MYWGKAIGFALGFSVGHPFIGTMAGHMFDTWIEGEIEKSDRPRTTQPTTQPTARATTTRESQEQSLCHGLALALRRAIAYDTPASRHKIEAIIGCVERSCTSPLTAQQRSLLQLRLDNFASLTQEEIAFVATTSASTKLKAIAMVHAWTVASARNIVMPWDIARVASFATKIQAPNDLLCGLGYHFTRVDTIEVVDAMKTLRVEPSKADTDLTASYRKLAKQLHPDRYIGLSSKEQKEATSQFAKLSTAYALVESLNNEPTTPIDWCCWTGGSPQQPIIARAEPSMIAKCILCHTKARLPSRENHFRSRCRNCKALLLFHRELFESWSRAAA